MSNRILRTWRCPRASSGVLPRHALYHDYVRYATPGNQRCPASILVAQLNMGILGGTVRIPLSSPKVIGVANSRGERA
jgi:hypothetical protein